MLGVQGTRVGGKLRDFRAVHFWEVGIGKDTIFGAIAGMGSSFFWKRVLTKKNANKVTIKKQLNEQVVFLFLELRCFL